MRRLLVLVATLTLLLAACSDDSGSTQDGDETFDAPDTTEALPEHGRRLLARRERDRQLRRTHHLDAGRDVLAAEEILAEHIEALPRARCRRHPDLRPPVRRRGRRRGPRVGQRPLRVLPGQLEDWEDEFIVVNDGGPCFWQPPSTSPPPTSTPSPSTATPDLGFDRWLERVLVWGREHDGGTDLQPGRPVRAGGGRLPGPGVPGGRRPAPDLRRDGGPGQPPGPRPRRPRHRPRRPRGHLRPQLGRVGRVPVGGVQAPGGLDQHQLPLRRGRARLPLRQRRPEGPRLRAGVRPPGRGRAGTPCPTSSTPSSSTTAPAPTSA